MGFVDGSLQGMNKQLKEVYLLKWMNLSLLYAHQKAYTDKESDRQIDKTWYDVQTGRDSILNRVRSSFFNLIGGI